MSRTSYNDCGETMVTGPCKWDRSSLHQSCSTQLDWSMCQIDRSVPVATTYSVLVHNAVLSTGSLSFSDVLLMNISPSMSVLSARGYHTVLVFKS